jgi:hypothetical protein
MFCSVFSNVYITQREFLFLHTPLTDISKPCHLLTHAAQRYQFTKTVIIRILTIMTNDQWMYWFATVLCYVLEMNVSPF